MIEGFDEAATAGFEHIRRPRKRSLDSNVSIAFRLTIVAWRNGALYGCGTAGSSKNSVLKRRFGSSYINVARSTPKQTEALPANDAERRETKVTANERIAEARMAAESRGLSRWWVSATGDADTKN